MPFYSLSSCNFRNLKNDTIDVFSKEVFFTGENGQGKSNLLEALYFSAYGSSFRTHTDAEMIKNGEKDMGIRVLYKGSEGDSHTTSIKLTSVQRSCTKKMEKDGKIIRDRKDLVNTMPCVLYNHDDLDFAAGSPERRRFFIDQTLSMYDILYIDVMRRYRHILKTRNLCLKEKKYSLLDTYDIQLVQNGLEMQKRRSCAIFKFNQIFASLYYEVSGIEGVNIRYIPSWLKTTDERAEDSLYADIDLPSVDNVIDILHAKRSVDQIMNTTMSGPHRDRIVFERKGKPFVSQASMGQRRLLALVLRTAQASYYTQETRRLPVLLMDDVLLELDPAKRERMTALLPEYDQLFCTFLPGEPYEKYRKNETSVYSIKSGEWNRMS